MRIRNILLITALLLTSLVSAAENRATVVLKNAADKIVASKTLKADFTMTTGSSTESGSIIIDRDKFRYTTPSRTVIFNGTTQWSIDKEVREINIYNPEAEEIDQINPFSLITNYRNIYDAKAVASRSASASRVELTPRRSGEAIGKVTITIDNATKLPETIEMTLSDGTKATIDITGIKTGVSVKSSQFTLDKNAYPGYETIDLR